VMLALLGRDVDHFDYEYSLSERVSMYSYSDTYAGMPETLDPDAYNDWLACAKSILEQRSRPSRTEADPLDECLTLRQAYDGMIALLTKYDETSENRYVLSKFVGVTSRQVV
jgi:hypothetical protein